MLHALLHGIWQRFRTQLMKKGEVAMSTADSGEDIWSRLRAYRQQEPLKYPPLTDEQALRFGIHMPPDELQLYTSTGDGFMWRPQIVDWPPATEEQLRATEERLGFPLPPDLRRLYAEVANGGLNLGRVQVFHGAIGGCGEYADVRPDGSTIEEFASDSGWRLHPRIEEALLRHPGRYVIVDSMPDGFIGIGQDSELSLDIDRITGYLYYSEYWGENPVAARPDDPDDGSLMSLELDAPSLSVWFARWLDDPWHLPPGDRGPLLAEMVETADLPDPEVVWRGLYRIGPAWDLRHEHNDS
jgi:SMI1 / KNR4 family (SUKH-1)